MTEGLAVLGGWAQLGLLLVVLGVMLHRAPRAAHRGRRRSRRSDPGA